jgi:putative RecB family exonuclease
MRALPKHTSASQLNAYARCPRSFKYRYLDDIAPELKSVSLALGSAVGSAIAWWYEEKQAGRSPTIAEATTTVRADLTAATHGVIHWGKWTEPDLVERAERLVACFLKGHGALPVIASEARFEVPLYDPDNGEVMPRRMLGFFDLVLEGRKVIELKTAQSEYKPVDIARSLQFGGYQLAMEAFDFQDGLDLVVLVKNKVPRLQQIRLKPSAATRHWFLESACAIERAIGAGHFPPAPGMSCTYCEYQHRCLGIARSHAQAA